MGRELDKRGFFSNEIVKKTEGTLDNRHSTFVVSYSSDVKGMTFFSSGSGGSKSCSGVSEILDGLSKINFSLISGVGTGSKMIRSSSEASFSFINFISSEGLFFRARSAVSGKHLIMFFLFLVNLIFKLIKES